MAQLWRTPDAASLVIVTRPIAKFLFQLLPENLDFFFQSLKASSPPCPPARCLHFRLVWLETRPGGLQTLTIRGPGRGPVGQRPGPLSCLFQEALDGIVWE